MSTLVPMNTVTWTDDKLDELVTKVDEGFDDVDRRFGEVDRRFDRVE